MAKNIWDVVGGVGAFDYNHLPSEELYGWATRQANRSEAYRKGELQGSSITEPARKQAMVERLRDAYETRSDLLGHEIEQLLKIFEARLEDPGLLDNFEYFDVPSSDFMLNFYRTLWERRIAEVMDYCHGYGKDLKGNLTEAKEDDVFYQMLRFEAMCVDARKKASATVDFIYDNAIVQATSFGGGNVPERLYALPDLLQLTVFDDGVAAPLEELFPLEEERSRVNYIHERLSAAPKHVAPESQDLVWMTGVSMYLKPDELVGAIICGAMILRQGGFMRYDSLIATESMRRVVSTQGWPYDPKNPMTIYRRVDEAIYQARETLISVNSKLKDSGIQMDLLDPEITMAEPWGPTSVRFTLQKHPI